MKSKEMTRAEQWEQIKQSQTIPTEWQDTSWLQDGCPSFSHKELHIWVDAKNPKDRDNQDTKRYAIHETYEIASGWGDVLIETDSFEAVLKFVEKWKMTLKQFQQTRKKVTGFYDYTDEEQGIPQVTAYTYWDTYDETIEGSNMVCECTHITIWDATTVAPTGQSYSELIKQFGGKYHLLLDRSEYNSNNLEELEKLLFEWTQEN